MSAEMLPPIASLSQLSPELQTLMTEATQRWPDEPDDALRRLLLTSDYATSIGQRHPEIWQSLKASGDLQRERGQAEFLSLASELATITDEQELMRALRLQRQREMLRWIYRDANGLCTVQSLTKELSYFADMCIAVARDFSHASLIKTYGEPIGEESGQAQSLCVIAMGKLGAYELNLSSDIDLIFSYPEAGETQAIRSIESRIFYSTRAKNY